MHIYRLQNHIYMCAPPPKIPKLCFCLDLRCTDSDYCIYRETK